MDAALANQPLSSTVSLYKPSTVLLRKETFHQLKHRQKSGLSFEERTNSMLYFIGHQHNEQELKSFPTASIADFECEEWVAIDAESEDEAIELFDTAFDN